MKPHIFSPRFAKTKKRNFARRGRTALCGSIAMLAACFLPIPNANAAPVYLDTNGASAGSGITSGSIVTWDGSSIWNALPDGTGALGAWVSGDIAVFSAGVDAAGIPYAVNVQAGGRTAGGLTFEDGRVSLSGGILTLNGGAVLNAGLGANASFANVLDGSVGLVKTGLGTIKLANSGNTYTGTTTISGGALVITGNGSLGASTSIVAVTGNTTFGGGGGQLVVGGSYAGGFAVARNFSFTGGGTWGDGAALLTVGNNTLSGAITTSSGSSTRLFSGFGTTVLSGSLTIGSGLTTQLGGNGIWSLTGTLTTPSAANTIFEKTGTGALIFAPSGTTLGAASEIRLSQGFTRMSSGTPLPSTGPILAPNGGFLEIRTDSTPSFSNAVLTLRGGSTVFADHGVGTLWTSGTPNINNTIAFGVTSFVNSGVTQSFIGRNGTNITLNGASGTNNITFATGNNITISNTSSGLTLNGLLTLNGNLVFTDTTARTYTVGNGNGDTVITGEILGTGAPHLFAKSGTGQLTLMGTGGTHTGATSISGGTLVLNKLSAIGETNAVNLSAGALTYKGDGGGAETTDKVFNLNGATSHGYINASMASGATPLVISGGVSAGGAGSKSLVLGGSSALDNEIQGLIQDNSASNRTSLYKTGSGTWVYAPNGAAAAGPAGITGSSGSNDNTLSVSDTTGLVVGMWLSGTNVPAGAVITSVGTGTITISDRIGTAVGASTSLTFGNVATFTGGVTVTNGTLKIRATSGSFDAVNNTSAVTFAVDGTTAPSLGSQTAGGIFRYDGFAGGSVESVGALTPSAGAGKVVVGTTGATLNFASLANRAAGATLDYQPGSGTIGFTVAPALQNGLLTDVAGKKAYATFNGVDWASLSGSNVSAATYTAYVSSGGVATTNYALAAGAGTTTSAAQSFNSLKLTATGGTLQLNGILTLASGGLLFDNSTGSAIIVNNGTAANTLGAVNSELIIVTNGSSPSNTLTVSALMGSGTASVTKAGSRTLIVTGSNTYTGNTVINEGTLMLSGATATLGVLSTAGTTMTIRQGGILDLNGAGSSVALSGGPAQPSLVTGMINGAGTIQNSGGGSSAQSVLVIGNGTVTTGTGVFSGEIKNNGGVLNLTKAGASSSVQYLTGDNSYTGVTTLTSGTLRVFKLADGGFSSGIGASSNAASNLVFNGGALQYTGSDGSVARATQTPSVSTDRLFTITQNGGVIDSSGTFGGSILGANANNATLIFSNTGAIVASGTGNRTLTLQGNSSGDNQFNPLLVNPGSGSLGLTKAGAGLWILNPLTSNTYSGATTITGGALQVAADGGAVLGLPTTSNLVIGGGVLQTSGNFTRAVGTGANQVQWTGNGGFAASSSKLTVNLGGGTVLNLGAAPTAGSTLILSSATSLAEVELQNPINLGTAARTIQVDDNSAAGTDFAIVSGQITGGAGGTLTKTGGGNLVLTSTTSGYVANTILGAGTLTVSNIDGASGGSNLGTNAGALLLGSGGGTGVQLNYVGAGERVTRAVQLNTTTGQIAIDSSGAGGLIIDGPFSVTANGAKVLLLRGVNTDVNEIKSVIPNSGSGATTIQKADSGNWILSGANTYTGGTNLAGGAFGIGSSTALGTGLVNVTGGVALFAPYGDVSLTNNLQVANGATALFSGNFSQAFATLNTSTINNAAGNGIITNNIVSGKTLTLGGTVGGGSVFNLQETTNSRVVTFAGSGTTIVNAVLQNGGTVGPTITGAITINAAGGTVVLNGTNTYTGNTTLTQGTLRLGNSNIIPDGAGFGNLTINPAASQTAIFDLNGKNETVNAFTATNNTAGSFSIIDNTSVAAASLTVGSNDGAFSFGAANGSYQIKNTGGGALSLTKTGTGTGTITNAATLTYNGGTTVNTGTLNIAAALNGTNALNVNGSGNVLNITGALSAPASIAGVKVDGGATLNIINGAGTHQSGLTSLNLGAGSGTATIGLEMGSTANYDRFTLASGSATTANAVNFNVTVLSGFGVGTYTLLSAPGGGLAGSTYTFSGLGTSALTTGYTFTKVTNANTVSLTAALAGSNFYWTNSQADNKWKTLSASLGSNWSAASNGSTDANGTPGAASTVNFSASNITGSGTLATTLEAPFAINDLVFNANTNGGAITGISIAPGTGGSLTLSPSSTAVGVTVQAGAPATITVTAPVTMGNTQTWNIASGSTFTASGGVAGPGFGIIKSGAGKMTLSGTGVNYTGTSTIDAGIFELNGTTAFASPVLFSAASTGTLQLASAAVTIPSLTTADAVANNVSAQTAPGVNSVLTLNQAVNTVFGGVLRDNGANTFGLVKNGIGSLTLNNASSHSGGTTLGNGTLILGNAAALGTGTLSISAGTTLDSSVANLVLTTNNPLAINGNFTFTGTNSLNVGTGAVTVGTTGTRSITVSNQTLTIGGSIGNSIVGLTKLGAGTLVLGGANLYTGRTTLAEGTIQANNARALGNGSVVTFSGGTLQFTANSTSTLFGLFKDSASPMRLDTNGQSIALTSFIDSTNTAGLLKLGAGTLALTADNFYTGTTTISTGTLQFGNGGTSGSVSAASPISVSSGTVLRFNRSNLLSVGNSIAGSGSMVQAGEGTAVITGANTGFTGTTTVSAGTLIATNPNSLGNNVGTNNVSVAGGALGYIPATNAQLLIGGAMTLTGGSGTAIGGTVGSSLTGAQINVAGTVTATGSTATGTAIPVNIYGVNGLTTGATGIYTLLHGGAGSNLNVPDYVLGTVYNNTNFTVNGLVTSSATDLQVDIVAATPLTNAYWSGTPVPTRGVSNIWSASNGVDTSNWLDSASTFSTQALVPGPNTDVWIAADLASVNAHPNSTVLGSNMSIKSLHIVDNENLIYSGLRLNADGNTLTIGTGGITVDSFFPEVPASVIAANVALGANQAWNNNSANSLTVSGTVSGAFSLSMGGTGTVVLSGANTYSGGTTLSAGTLSLGSASALASGALTITGGALASTRSNLVNTNNNALNINADFAFNGANSLDFGTGAITLGGAGARTITVNAGLTLTLDGSIAATAVGLTKAGTGTLVLGGNNLYTGLTTINDGTLRADSATALGGVGAGNIQFGGGTLQYAAASAATDWGSRFKNSTGALSLDTNTQDVAIATLIDGTNTNGLTKIGFGGLKLSNSSNAYTGTTTVSGGSLIINSMGALGTSVSQVIVNGSPSKLIGGGSLVLEGGSTGVNFTRSILIGGFGANFNQSSSLVSVRNNEISGAITVTSPVSATATSSRFNSANGMLTISGPLTISTATAVSTVFGGVNAVGVGNIDFKGSLNGPGNALLTKTSAGTLILNPALNTAGYAGTFRVEGGTVRIDSASVLGTNSAVGTLSVLDFNGGTLEVRSDSGAIGRNVYQRAGAVIFADHSLTGMALNGAATFGPLMFEENQTLTLNGRNGYGVGFGVATVNGGTGNSTINNNLNGALTFTGNFWTNPDATARTMTFGGNGETLITGDVVATGGAHNLTKTGSGMLTITGTASTYTGSTTVTGTLSIGDLGAINKTVLTSAVNLNSGTVLYTGGADSLAKPINLQSTTGANAILSSGSGALSISGNVNATGAGVKVLYLGGSNTNDNTFSSVLLDNSATNTTGLTKIGAGTWVLQAPVSPGTWSGPLTVANGTLKLSATSGTSNIVKNANNLIFNTDAFGGSQSAGGTLNYVNDAGTAVTETLNAINPAAGAGKIVLTPNGQTTTLTFAAAAPLLNRVAGATLDYQPGTGTISFTTPPALQNGLLTDAAARKAYATINGVNWASLSGSNVSAVAYSAYVAAGGVATANYFLAAGAGTTPSATQSFNSLKLTGTGGTLQLNGPLTLTSGGLLFDNSAGSLTIANNGTLTNTLGGAGSELIVITNGNSPTNALTVSARIGSTSASLTKAGTRTLVVSGDNTYTGNTVINEGTLRLSGPTATLGVLSAAGTTMTVRQTATLDLNGAGPSVALSGGPAQPSLVTGMINGAGTIWNSGGGGGTQSVLVIGNGTVTTGTGVFSGIIADNGGILNLTKAGSTSSVQYLTGENTYTGVTTLTSGTLRVFKLADGGTSSGIGASSSAAGNLVFNGGALMYTGSDGTTLQLGQTPSVSTNRLFTITANGGTIDSSGNFGNSVLAAAQNNAALVFGNSGAVVVSGTGDRTLTLQGNSTGDNLLNPLLSNPGTGTLGITKTGGGVWVLGNSSNSYSGTTTITAGVLRAQDFASLPNASNLVFNGGVLESTGNFNRVIGPGANGVQFTAVGSGGFAAASSKLTVNLGGSAVWGTGPFLGTGNLILSSSTALSEVEIASGIQVTQGIAATLNVTTTAGSATVNLTSGSTAGLALGQVISGNPNIPVGATIASITSPTQFTLTSGTGVIAATSIATNVAAGGYRQIVVSDNGNTNTDFATITGTLSGTGSIRVSGGVLQLLGANTYSGTTSVVAGTLVVNSLGLSSGAPTGTSLGINNGGMLTIGNGNTGAAILEYVGTGETSDRMILIDTTTGSDQIHADGSGPLVLTNVVNNTSLTGARTLFLRGSNTQANVLGGSLADGAGAGSVFNITIDGGATWVLAGNNSFTGNVNANSGSLGIGSTNALGNGTLVLNNGLQYLFAHDADQSVSSTSRVQVANGATALTIGNFSLEFNGATQLVGAATITNNIIRSKWLSFAEVNSTGGGNFTLNGAGDTLINGPIANAATALNLIYSGTGSLTLGASSTYTGNTSLSNGLTILAGGGGGSMSTNRLPGTTALTMTGTSTLQLGDASGPTNQTLTSPVSGYSFAVTSFIVGGNTSPNPEPSVLNLLANVDSTFSFAIGKSTAVENNLKLVKTGSGTLTVTAVNRYTGGTDVGSAGGPSGGKLVVETSGTLGDVFTPAPLNVYAGTVQVKTGFQIVSDLNLGGGAAGTTARATIDGDMQVNGNIVFDPTNNANPAVIDGLSTLNLRPSTFTTIAVGVSPTGSGALAPDLTISAMLGGSQPIHKTGAGTLMLTTPSPSLTGTVFVDQGSLILDSRTPGFQLIPSTASVSIGTVTNGAKFNLGSWQGEETDLNQLTLHNNSTLTMNLGTPVNSDYLNILNLVLDSSPSGLKIDINSLSGFGLGSYTILTSNQDVVSNPTLFTLGATPAGFSYTLTGVSSFGLYDLILNVAPASTAYYWKGNGGNARWTTTNNFVDGFASATPTVGNPSLLTDVFFSSNSPVAGTQANTIVDINMQARTLNINDAAVMTVKGNAGTVLSLGTGGIVIGASSGAVTIGSIAPADALSLGVASSQNWDSSGTGILTILSNVFSQGTSGVQTLSISGSQNVIIQGAILDGTSGGQLALAKNSGSTLTLDSPNNNAYTGGTKIGSGGIIQFTAGSLPSTGTIEFVNTGGTLRWFGTNTDDLSDRLKINDIVTGIVDTNGNNVTFASVLQFGAPTSGTLTKAGAGTLKLGANNSTGGYFGGTNIQAGTVEFVQGAFLSSGSVTPGNVTFTGVSGVPTLKWSTGNTDDVSAFLRIDPAVTGTLDTNGNDVVFGSAVNNGGPSTTGALTKTGAGMLSFDALSSPGLYTGGTSIAMGTLAFASGDMPTSGAVTFTGDSVLRWGTVSKPTNSDDISNRLRVGDNVTGTIDTGANTVTFNSAINAAFPTSGAVTKSGSGTLILLAAAGNNYTGGTNVASGTLQFSSGAIPSSGNFTFTGDSTLKWGASNTDDVSNRSGAGTQFQVLSGVNATIDIGSNNVSFAKAIQTAGSSSLTKVGGGTLNLSVANPALLGAFNLGGGTVQTVAGSLSSASVVDFKAASTLTWLSGNIDDLSSRLVIDDLVAATLNVAGAGDTVTFSAPISNNLTSTGSMTKDGPGTLKFATSNATGGYSGGTFINAGTLEFVGGAFDNSLLLPGNITFTGTSGSPTLRWSTGNTQDVSGLIKITNGVTATLDTNGNNVVFSSPVQSGSTTTGTLTKGGGGTLTLASSVPGGYTGGTNIDGGTLQFASSALTGTGNVRFTGNSTLRWGSSNTDDIASLNGIQIANGVTGTIDTNGNNVTFAVPVQTGPSSTGALTKTGNGTLSLSSGTPGGYTGGTNISGGALQFVAGAIPATGNVTFTGDGTLKWAPSNTEDVSNRLNIAAGVNGTVDTNGNNVSFANPLQGAGASSGNLIKAGAGKLSLLTANPNLQGAVTVSGGTLEASVSGSLSGTTAVNVSSGGTLQLAGTGNRINDSAPVTMGTPSTSVPATFLANNSVEQLGAFTLAGDSVIDFSSFNASAPLRFANSSATSWLGTLSIYNWSGNAVSGGGLDQLFFGTDSFGLTPEQLAQINFFSDAGATLLGAGAVYASAGEVVPVPEPGALIALFGGAGMLLGMRRRRPERAV